MICYPKYFLSQICYTEPNISAESYERRGQSILSIKFHAIPINNNSATAKTDRKVTVLASMPEDLSNMLWALANAPRDVVLTRVWF